MKKLILSLGVLIVPSVFAFMVNTMDPRMMQQGQQGFGPSMMAVGEQPTNMINGQVCPPQIAPMQAPLGQQGVMPLMNQYNQGIHGQQMFQTQ